MAFSTLETLENAGVTLMPHILSGRIGYEPALLSGKSVRDIGRICWSNFNSDHAISADSSTRLIVLILGINAATDDPYRLTNGSAVPAQRVDRHTPSPVIGRPAASMRGIRRGCKLVAAQQRATDAINLSSLRSFFWSPR